MIEIRNNVEGSAWDEALSALPVACRDIYFTSGYHALHDADGGSKAYCMSFTDGAKRLLIPGMLVPIDNEPGLKADVGLHDLQTCNGYGGPLASPEADRDFLNAAWAEWRHQSAKAGIVAGFFRLHPLLENHIWLPDDAKVLLERQTVYVNVKNGVQSAWEQADSRHRNMVNKGRREGINVSWQTSAWEQFESLYLRSMERLNAPVSLRFSPAYFKGLRELPAVELASIWNGDRLVAGAVFMYGPAWGHYHLSARDEGFGNHLTNCLLQSGIERAAALGLEGIHLGGGRTGLPDDGLLKFKRSVGASLLNFRVALIVADADAYQRLCSRWATETGTEPKWLLGYRQPKAMLQTEEVTQH